MVNNRRFLSPLDKLRRGSLNAGHTKQDDSASSEETSDGRSVEEGGGEGRAQWGNALQFFFTLLGYCVGLGNIWRFPYLCQKNGGGAFVIPFLIMMALEGMPLLLLELALGQKMRTGCLGVWKVINPYLGGIGLGSAVISIVVGCYYNVIIAWCIYYLANSFRGTLPWSSCPTLLEAGLGDSNTTLVPECEMSSETQYFWYRNVLDSTDSIGDFGGIKWWMLVCLVVSWLIVYAITMKGIQSSGKVVYFTAMFPYLVLTIFFVRGLTLKGASAGLAHMFYPKMESLLNPSVWMDAANQVFYSYGLAFGSMISFGSYNPPNKNCVKDVLQLSLCNALTAIYGCAVIFAILGFKAQTIFDKCMNHDVTLILSETDLWEGRSLSEITPVEYEGLMASDVINATNHALKNCSLTRELDQAAQGTGLAFIVMADVFTKLPGAPVWSILFFAMLLSLGLGSQIGILEGFISTLFDMPRFARSPKPLLTGIACLTCFLIGLVFVTGAGEYWLTLFDSYGAMGLTFIALVEIISVMYVYGHDRFMQDIAMMTGGKRPSRYWEYCLRFVAPLLLALVTGLSVVSQFTKSPTYSAWSSAEGKSVQLPYTTGAMVVAVGLATASLVPIVSVALSRIFVGASGSDEGGYEAPIKRVATDASTLPMMTTVASDQKLAPEDEEATSGLRVDIEDSQRNL